MDWLDNFSIDYDLQTSWKDNGWGSTMTDARAGRLTTGVEPTMPTWQLEYPIFEIIVSSTENDSIQLIYGTESVTSETRDIQTERISDASARSSNNPALAKIVSYPWMLVSFGIIKKRESPLHCRNISTVDYWSSVRKVRRRHRNESKRSRRMVRSRIMYTGSESEKKKRFFSSLRRATKARIRNGERSLYSDSPMQL